MALLTACASPVARAALATPEANANDIVLTGGTYGTLTYDQSGTPDDWVVVWGNYSTAQCIRVEGEYIIVRDMIVEGCDDHGILVSGKHVIIEDNKVTRIESDRFTSDRFTSDGSYCTTDGEFGSAIKMMIGAEDVTVRNNMVHHNCGEGIAATRATNILIEGNHVYDNHNVDIYIDNSHDVTVRNNVVTCDQWAVAPGTNGNGIALGEEDYGPEWGAQLHDVLITENTVRGCRIGIVTFSSLLGGVLRDIKIDNNRIETGLERSISVLSPAAQNVAITNNGVWTTAFTIVPETGVSVSDNYILTDAATLTLPPPGTQATAAPNAVPTVCEFSPSFMICTRP